MKKFVRVVAEITVVVGEDDPAREPGETPENVAAGYVYTLEESHDTIAVNVREARVLTMDEVLYAALEEMDGWDGVLETAALRDYLAKQYGDCPWSLEELEVWLTAEKAKNNAPFPFVASSLFSDPDDLAKIRARETEGETYYYATYGDEE